MLSLVELLGKVPDHRLSAPYPLAALLSLSIVAFMCGRTSLSGISRFAKERSAQELYQLGFKRCLRPSQNTLSVVFSGMDVSALERVLGQASSQLESQEGFHHLAMDGKRLCGSVSDDRAKGVHLVSLFSQRLSGVLGQTPTEKGNEITAAIALLSEVDLEGCVVTGDAIFCQKEICRIIRDKGGHYVMALKDNHKPLKQAVEKAFSLRPDTEPAAV